MDGITDRTRADLIARNSKAFFNVADWQRVDDNCQTNKATIESEYDTTVTLAVTTAPEAGDFADVDDINTLVGNIETLRLAACLPSGLLVVLKHDYKAGVGSIAPDYNDVNDWEQNLLLIDELVPLAADYFAQCGVAAAGQDHFWQARFRG